MSKYRVVFEREVRDRLFDTYEQTKGVAGELCSCNREDFKNLHLSTPGENNLDEDESSIYEIEQEPDYEFTEKFDYEIEEV